MHLVVLMGSALCIVRNQRQEVWLLHGCRKEARKQQLKEAAGNIKSSGKDQQVRSAMRNMPAMQTCLGLIVSTPYTCLPACPHASKTLIWGDAGRRQVERCTGMTRVDSCRL